MNTIISATLRAYQPKRSEGSRFAVRFQVSACREAPALIGLRVSCPSAWRDGAQAGDTIHARVRAVQKQSTAAYVRLIEEENRT